MNNKIKLLEVKNLSKFFIKKSSFIYEIKKILKFFFKKIKLNDEIFLKAFENVSFDVYKGEVFCIVGESGCGKTTLGRTILNLYKQTSGHVIFQGKENILNIKNFRKECQMIFQNPYSSLNPLINIGNIIAEPLEVFKIFSKDKSKRKELILESMKLVGLPASYFEKYPNELSGGQRQRVGIARSLILKPKLIICDEPISALDVSIQAQILNLFIDLKKKMDLTYIFITHNLTVVKNLADRIMVMYLGNIVELTTAEKLFSHPMHPYTKLLINSILIPDPKQNKKEEELKSIKENKENNQEVKLTQNKKIQGCCFQHRCNKFTEECLNKKPELKELEKDHLVACFNPD